MNGPVVRPAATTEDRDVRRVFGEFHRLPSPPDKETLESCRSAGGWTPLTGEEVQRAQRGGAEGSERRCRGLREEVQSRGLREEVQPPRDLPVGV